MTGDRTELLRRLVAPPGPTSPTGRATWDALDEGTRRELRRAATDVDAARTVLAPARRRLVHELAVRRAARAPLDLLGPVVTGLFVLSTLWGFGRAAVPASADAWLVAGLLGMAATVVVGRRRVASRRRSAASVVDALGATTDRPSGAGH